MLHIRTLVLVASITGLTGCLGFGTSTYESLRTLLPFSGTATIPLPAPTPGNSPSTSSPTSGSQQPITTGVSSTIIPSPLPIKALACTKTIGSGSGAITITQKDLSLVDDDVVCIKAGTYNSISISNIAANSGHPITIQNNGLVNITGSTYGPNFSNLVNVAVSGAGLGLSGGENGIVFHDLSYRAIQIQPPLREFTLNNIDFTNIGDYAIFIQNNNVYDGTQGSLIYNIHFLNLHAKNLNGDFILTGASGLNGLSQNFEIAYCTIDTGYNFAGLNGSFNVNVHHNVIQNINLNSNTHQGIVMLQGDGRVHHNYFNHLLGESVRAWPSSLGQVGALNIYNNIFLNTVKYSPIEIQPNTPSGGGFTSAQDPHFTYTNYNIYNNTAGNINLCALPVNPATLPTGPGCWYGALVDSYSSDGGTLTIENNLVFNINGTNKGDAIQNGQGTLYGKAIVKNNLVYDTYQSAGLLDDIFVRLLASAPAVGAGFSLPTLVTDDYYGKSRSPLTDIGATQH